MEAFERCNCGCGLPRPLRGRRGPREIYATPACRKRAFDRKHYLAFADANSDSQFTVQMPERRYASPLERIAQSVLETQVLCNHLDELGREADPRLGWRVAKLAKEIRYAIVSSGLAK